MRLYQPSESGNQSQEAAARLLNYIFNSNYRRQIAARALHWAQVAQDRLLSYDSMGSVPQCLYDVTIRVWQRRMREALHESGERLTDAELMECFQAVEDRDWRAQCLASFLAG